ncbi:MAG: phosphatase PAP2 family protein [Acidimicrobiia bacterium]|nr:phosphatase PAP2 family protein [Acidimicrobiia bacterium]
MSKVEATMRASVGDRLFEFAVQFGFIVGAALLYFGVRGLTEGSEAIAVANGLDLLAFERAIGVAVEAELQHLILDHRWAVTAANWVYIWGHWPAIAATLVWLHRTRRFDYLLLRNALFVSGAIGLVIFVMHPVAPPRLLPSGFTDTVTELSASYRVLQPPSLVNKYAALPSLHVGWNLLIGLALVRTRANWLVRTVGMLSPLAMAAAVVLTGNHYLIDALAGAVVALTGLAVSYAVTPKLAMRPVVRHRLTPAGVAPAPFTAVRADLADRPYQPRSTHSWR